ncbi:transmembrane protein [Cavenderia fasciculata]|uniref:Transmembrane protein n=1 Tax=Cavenderia fasciculata TaxID=261658 RepID=F4QCE0_CACFS|nr:uncharacterized protein DFA_11336 [Cavenderia fasciculata]EGG13575.1 transmembrane protein [Cavenderia fasciculata]|eukprot:XP_004350279.1 transmembrane protein [Cavenderia fasciculata]
MTRSFDSLSKSHCSGRMVTGPDKMYFVSALILMFIPEIPFLVTVCQLFEEYIKAGIYVISIFLWLSSYVFILITSYTDPGIVPRGSYSEAAEAFNMTSNGVKLVVYLDLQEQTIVVFVIIVLKNSTIIVLGLEIVLVEEIINILCTLLFTVGTTCSWMIGICIANIVIYAQRARLDHPFDSSASIFNMALNESHYLSIIIIVYALGGMIFVGSLGGFHCYLIVVAKTTNEHIKKSFRKGNPFTDGLLRNCFSIFCGPHFPSFYRMTHKEKNIELMALPPLANNNNNNNDSNHNLNNLNNASPSSSTTTPLNNISSSSPVLNNQNTQNNIDIGINMNTAGSQSPLHDHIVDVETQPTPSPPSSSSISLHSNTDDDDDDDDDDGSAPTMNLKEFLQQKSRKSTQQQQQQDDNKPDDGDKEDDKDK